MKNAINLLVVGCGNMGASHARAYHKMPEFNIVGLVSRRPESRSKLSKELGGYPDFSSYQQALEETKPQAVSINTYPDTHAQYAYGFGARSTCFCRKTIGKYCRRMP